MFAQRPQIRVFGQPFEIAVTQRERLVERGRGQIHRAGEGIAARKIVEDQRIARFKPRQLLVHFEAILIFTALGVMIPQKLQGLDVFRIATHDPFHELYLDIELPRFPPIHFLFDAALFRHTTVELFPRGIIKSRVTLEKSPRGAKKAFDSRASSFNPQRGMNCFVTGASGFIGANLVHELLARGHRVKALLRPETDLRGLVGADFERVTGDVGDRDKLIRAMAGCDWCFHVAASYHLWLKDYRPMYAANVDGTRNVLHAAGTAGCSRIVYTSTVGCVGLPVSIRRQTGPPTDETATVTEAGFKGNHYKISKLRAENVALQLASEGLPIVIVNPSAPVGPRDVKPTPTGQVIVNFLNRKMPAYLDTGLNWVHARDVAIGHILAAEKGRLGERYILGSAQGNWTMKEAFAVLEEITGVRAPRIRIPYRVAWLAACADELKSKFTGGPPRAPLAGVRMALHKMFFNPAKALRELGLPQTPPKQALADAVEWFRVNGYVKS